MVQMRSHVQYSILLADDDRATRDVLREIIETQYRTFLAADGEEALHIVRSELIHVAVFDVHMPKLTGLETLQILRGIGADLPVILITGDSSAGLIRQAFQAHAYSVIPKPVNKNVVLHTVGLRWTGLMAALKTGPKLDRSGFFIAPRRFVPMNVVPLNDKIVVKRVEADSTTAGGIVLPDTAKEKPKQGRVVSLGDGKLLDDGKRAKFQVKEGDRVLFTSYAGSDVKIGSEEYLIMTEDDILAIVE